MPAAKGTPQRKFKIEIVVAWDSMWERCHVGLGVTKLELYSRETLLLQDTTGKKMAGVPSLVSTHQSNLSLTFLFGGWS